VPAIPLVLSSACYRCLSGRDRLAQKGWRLGRTVADVAAPLAQEGARDGGLRGEDGDGDGALGCGGALGAAGDDVVAVEALVLYALVAQEVAQPPRGGDGAALAPCRASTPARGGATISEGLDHFQ